ncbi:MAG: ribosome biogenesis GTPase Der [Bacteroides sp.]|nr:ribosome biogenesis GTPase Der [Ruminococcus flavefaciens]MCM1555626.1 ribosome biogenesis GTPase Der [Bacteroides sp.]
MRNIVAIVGRPNVGKSTLFNRLIQSRHAIVDETSGVTRDRNYGTGDWNGKEFSVIDTGGYLLDNEDSFNSEIRKQVELAIDEADVILFLVDGKDGITPMDEDVAQLLRRTDKPVHLVVNKIDSPDKLGLSSEFYALGFDTLFCLSAANGGGTGDLLDEVVRDMGEPEEPLQNDDLPRITVIGRPNVGKSSIINAFIGQERNIVTPIAGTTRDTVLTRYKLFDFDFYLVDTAGIRRKQKVTENIEFYSVMRSIRAIENSDVCILMLDAESGIEAQDLNLYALCRRNNKGVVVVVNKWDLVEKENNTLKKYEAAVRERLAPDNDIPIVFTSVVNKQRIYKVLEMAKQVHENRSRRISTSDLNETLLPILKQTPPPVYKGKSVKIKYITQLPGQYPMFALFCNLPQYVKEPYRRFVENQLRRLWDFTGVPMKIFFREK